MEKLLYGLLISLASLLAFSGLRQADAVWEERQTSASSATAETASDSWKGIWQLRADRSYTPLAPSLVKLLSPASASSPEEKQRLHALSLGLHISSSLLVLFILSLVLGSNGAAFWGALLFALHPLQVESLVNFSSLPYVLGSFFALLALWQYLIYFAQDERRRHHSRTPFLIASFALVLALLSSAATVVTPLLALVLLQLGQQQDTFRQSRGSAWPLALWFLLAIFPLFWAVRAQEVSALAQEIPFWKRPLLAGDAISFYLVQLMAPFRLGPDYGRSPAYVLSHWWGYLSFLLPLVLLIVMGFARDLRAYFFTALSWFVLAALPFLGFVLFPAQANSTVADSYMYLAIVGPAIALAGLFVALKSNWLPVLTVCALIGLATLTHRQLGYWGDDASLWQYAVSVNPRSPKVHTALGDAALKQGRYPEAKQHYEQVLAVNRMDPRIYFKLGRIAIEEEQTEKAIELFQQAVKIDPKLVEAHGELGLAHFRRGQMPAALLHFRQATDLAPEHSLYLSYHGRVAVEQGHFEEGMPLLERALALGVNAIPSEKAQLHTAMGRALAHTAQNEKAQQHLEQALALDKGQAEAHHLLGDLLFEQKRWQAALPHYEVALQRAPQDAEIYRRLGEIRLQIRQYDRAIAAFTSALRFRADWPEVLSSRGEAYYHLRRFPEAKANLLRSLALKPQQAEAHYLLGEIGRWLGPESVAAAAYQEALKIDPKHVEARYRLGNWHLKRSRFAEAARQYKVALEVAPQDGRLLTQLQKAERREPEAMSIDAASR